MFFIRYLDPEIFRSFVQDQLDPNHLASSGQLSDVRRAAHLYASRYDPDYEAKVQRSVCV